MYVVYTVCIQYIVCLYTYTDHCLSIGLSCLPTTYRRRLAMSALRRLLRGISTFHHLEIVGLGLETSGH